MLPAVRVTELPAGTGFGAAANDPTCGADGMNRTTAVRTWNAPGAISVQVEPATTNLPSPDRRMPEPPVMRLLVMRPPLPNEVSRLPLALYRTSASWEFPPFSGVAAPATTNL